MATIEVTIPRFNGVVPADVFKVALMYSVQKLGYFLALFKSWVTIYLVKSKEQL